MEENWTYFYSHHLKITENHFPTKLLSTRSRIPWSTTPLQHFIRKKQRVYNKAKKFHQSGVWSEYSYVFKSQIKHLLRHHHDKYLSNIIMSSNKSKPFWYYVKSKRQDHSGISTLISTTGTIASESSEKAEAFNEYIKSVFTLEGLSYISDKATSP